MSIINQMLRDLDARQAGDAERTSLPCKLRPLPKLGRRPSQAKNWLLALTSGTALAAGTLYWSSELGLSQPPLPQTVAATSALTDDSQAAVALAGDADKGEKLAVANTAELASAQSPQAGVPPLIANPQLDGQLSIAPADGQAMPPQAKIKIQRRQLAQPLSEDAQPQAKMASADIERAAASLTVANSGTVDQVAEPAAKIKLAKQQQTHKPAKLTRAHVDGSKAAKPKVIKVVAAKSEKIDTLPRREAEASAASAMGKIDIQASDNARSRAERAFAKGMQATELGDKEEIKRAMRLALSFDPNMAKARQALLSVLVSEQQWEEAQRVAKGGLNFDPGRLDWATVLARLQFEQGKIDAALETLTRQKITDSGDSNFHSLYAFLLQKKQRGAEAAHHYRRALNLRPREGRWWFGLGLALESQGKLDDAKIAYAKALDSDNLPAEMARIAKQVVRN